jgi:hypothetical protein
MRSVADLVEIKKGEDMKSKSTETKTKHRVLLRDLGRRLVCFSKMIPTLQADGHQVIAAQLRAGW